MKILYSLVFVLVAPFLAEAQGTLVFDQQSATQFGLGAYAPINSNQPIGQGFTPTLTSVGFVQLQLREVPPSSLIGASLVVRLWGDSLGGVLLGETSPVFMPPDFYGITNFIFSAPVAVVPGQTYYFQPVIASGGDERWSILTDFYSYAGGDLYIHGLPRNDGLIAWFREGIIVPEPSPAILIGLGLMILVYARRVDNKRCSSIGTELVLKRAGFLYRARLAEKSSTSPLRH